EGSNQTPDAFCFLVSAFEFCFTPHPVPPHTGGGGSTNRIAHVLPPPHPPDGRTRPAAQRPPLGADDARHRHRGRRRDRHGRDRRGGVARGAGRHREHGL